jgi:hypothetical protein
MTRTNVTLQASKLVPPVSARWLPIMTILG